MERFDIDAAIAFARLKQMSQNRNTPIARVAHRVAGGDSLLFK
jgi:AmiR/NasT family two-component response regulator